MVEHLRTVALDGEVFRLFSMMALADKIFRLLEAFAAKIELSRDSRREFLIYSFLQQLARTQDRVSRSKAMDYFVQSIKQQLPQVESPIVGLFRT